MSAELLLRNVFSQDLCNSVTENHENRILLEEIIFDSNKIQNCFFLLSKMLYLIFICSQVLYSILPLTPYSKIVGIKILFINYNL